MSESDDLSPEDKEAFRRAMQDVEPIAPTKKIQPKNKPAQRSKSRQNKAAPSIDSHHEIVNYTLKSASADEILWYHQSGIHHKTLNRLRRGQLTVMAEIDCHGLTAIEAIESCHQFINQCLQRDFRCVRIIHGKGLRSISGTATLKSHLNSYLRAHPEILAFCSAPPRQGGTGAVLVLLRSNSKPPKST